MRLALLSCLVSVVFTGCAAIEDYHYCWVHEHRASKAYSHSYAWRDRWAQSAHYADGWKKGYYDVSTGSNGQPPAIPPTKYWAPSYQDSKGQSAIHDWYAGYQDGATAAQSDGTDHWHWIPTGPTIPSTEEIHAMETFGPEMMGPVDTLHPNPSAPMGAPIQKDGTHQINTWPQIPEPDETPLGEPTPARQATLTPIHLLPSQGSNSPIEMAPVSVDPNSFAPETVPSTSVPVASVPPINVPPMNVPAISVPAPSIPAPSIPAPSIPAPSIPTPSIPTTNAPPAKIAPSVVPPTNRSPSDIISRQIFPPVVTDEE